MTLRVTQQPAWVNSAFDSPQTHLLHLKHSVTQQEPIGQERKLNEKPKVILALEAFQKKAIGLATGDGTDYEEYESARSDLLEIPKISSVLPEWVRQCRYGSQFWGLMKKESDTYQGRRYFIYSTLGVVFNSIERSKNEPIGMTVDHLMKLGTSTAIEECWHRILERKDEDPEGAITAARSMVESTCKHILDTCNAKYTTSDDLNNLYKKVGKELKLSPADHDEQIFKQILSGCSSVVIGFAGLRNAYGDAHGKGKGYFKPSARHAELAINIAGTMTTFLLKTLEMRGGAKRGQTEKP